MRSLRVVVVLVVVVAVAAACSSTSSARKRKGKRHTTTTVSRTYRTPNPVYSTRTYTPTPTSTRATGTPGTTCRANDVAVQVRNPRKESADLVVTSDSRTCTLTGYPDVALRDAAYDVPTTVNRQPGPAATTVRLSRGRSATSRLTWDSTEPNGEDCTTHPTGLRVTLPGGTSTTALWPASNEMSICDDTITVGAFR